MCRCSVTCVDVALSQVTTSSSRYERHFAPNVSLAPAPYQKSKGSEFDKEKESECEAEKRPRTPSSATLSTSLSTDEPFTNLSSDTEESQSGRHSILPYSYLSPSPLTQRSLSQVGTASYLTPTYHPHLRHRGVSVR